MHDAIIINKTIATIIVVTAPADTVDSNMSFFVSLLFYCTINFTPETALISTTSPGSIILLLSFDLAVQVSPFINTAPVSSILLIFRLLLLFSDKTVNIRLNMVLFIALSSTGRARIRSASDITKS